MTQAAALALSREMSQLDRDVTLTDEVTRLANLVESELTRPPSQKVSDFLSELWGEIKTRSKNSQPSQYPHGY